MYGHLPLSTFSVRETERKGLGLFASAPIRKMDQLKGELELGLEVVGELLPRLEGDRRELEHQLSNHAGYCIHQIIDEFGTQWTIDTLSCGNLSRFVNHSCAPNFKAWIISSNRRCRLFPLRDIAGQWPSSFSDRWAGMA